MALNTQTQPWGQHLILDFNGCPRDLLASKENILNWTKDLVEAIDMVAYGEPIVEHFATHSHEAAGYTMLQMIETSNIAAHFAENIGQVYIDIFSCKTFDVEKALDVCKKYFAPETVHQASISRGFHQQLPLKDGQYEDVDYVRAA
ncbi:MAG: S-adenosylmethionine decarboxylase [Alcanivorax sp.]